MSISLNIDSNTSSNVSIIEKPKFDINGKHLTHINLSLYTNVDRQVVLALKVSIVNFILSFGIIIFLAKVFII